MVPQLQPDISLYILDFLYECQRYLLGILLPCADAFQIATVVLMVTTAMSVHVQPVVSSHTTSHLHIHENISLWTCVLKFLGMTRVN